MLVQRLEQHPAIALAHAFNKGYERKHRCNNDIEIEQVQEGGLEFLVKENETECGTSNADAPQSRSGAPQQDGSLSPSKRKDNGTTLSGVAVSENGDVSVQNGTQQGADTVVPGPTEIFTTTHYIGLELVEGKLC